jgi:hypothetical protein
MLQKDVERGEFLVAAQVRHCTPSLPEPATVELEKAHSSWGAGPASVGDDEVGINVRY